MSTLIDARLNAGPTFVRSIRVAFLATRVSAEQWSITETFAPMVSIACRTPYGQELAEIFESETF